MADSRLSGSHVRRIEGHVPGWRRGASAAAALACIVAGVVLVALAYVLASPPSGLCQMSYSKPRYARTILPSSATIDRLPSTYALYTYTDGFAQYTMVLRIWPSGLSLSSKFPHLEPGIRFPDNHCVLPWERRQLQTVSVDSVTNYPLHSRRHARKGV